jgi:hypothetical protein
MYGPARRQQFPDARLKIVSMTDVYFPLVANDKFDVGGLLRLRPPKRQIVFANRALQYNSPEVDYNSPAI